MTPRPLTRLLLTLGWVFLLSFCFAMTEIQIEGAAGWAANLPTWRIEEHWLLDIFWSSRPLTGYHIWVFSFMALMFHFPFILLQQWTLRLQARALACLMLFWIMEDALWFVLNPAYGLAALNPVSAPWHKHWILGLPTDYWISGVVAVLLLWYSLPRGALPRQRMQT